MSRFIRSKWYTVESTRKNPVRKKSPGFFPELIHEEQNSSSINLHPHRKWPCVEKLSEAVNMYFESCISRNWVLKHDEDGNEYREEIIKHIKPYTVSGLGAYLGMNRNTMMDYENKYEDSHHIMVAAKAKILAFAEEYLFSGKSCQGAIFSIKNTFQGWEDRTHQEISGTNHINVSINDDKAKVARAQLLQQVEGILVVHDDEIKKTQH